MSKTASLCRKTQKFVAALIAVSLLGNFSPNAFGQNDPSASRAAVQLKRAADERQAFARVLPFARNAEFAKVLERELGAQGARAAFALFDEKDKSFFEAVYAAHRQNAQKLVEQRNAPLTVKPAPIKRAPVNRRRAAFENTACGAFFQNASFQPLTADAQQEPVITTLDTPDGVKTVGEVKNTVETAETVITKGSNADTERILNNARNGLVHTQTSFEEVYNKQNRSRVRHEKKMQMAVLLAQCPDANGAVEGEATVTIENKATIANTTTIAIPAQSLTMKVKLKGIVNDDAQLVAYDLTGEVAETTTGYDRAKKLDMIDDEAFSDGTRRFSIEAAGNKIDAAQENPDIRQGSTDHLSVAENNRLIDFVNEALPMNLVNADNAFQTSRENWQKGFCVEVKLAAPKTKLVAGERVAVAAETVHRLDNTKIDARMEAEGFAEIAPAAQEAKPSAQFSVTASTKDDFGAEITVKSVSRRGIGTSTLSFGKEKPPVKKPPVKKPSPAKKCTGAWTGTIHVEKRKRTEKTSPESGRLVRQVDVLDETFSINYSLLGIADTSGGLLNGYFADSQTDYRELRYQESNYAPGKMSCAKKIISSPETRKIENLMTGTGRGRLTVYVTSTGEKGVLTFGSPELKAERVTTRTYETACPDYDRVNSGSDRFDGWIEIVEPSFEIEFELDANSNTQLNGSKTIQNSDGSETIVRWALTRECR